MSEATPKEVTQAAMTEAGDLLPNLLRILERVKQGYSTAPSELRALLVSRDGETILSALRNTRAPITPSVDKLVED